MTSKISKIQIDQQNLLETKIEDSKEENQEKEEASSISAEEATKIAIDFLKSLGIKKSLPSKASNMGKKTNVELDLKGKRAVLYIDGETKEILEYEIEPERSITKEGEKTPFKLILILIGIQFLIVVLFDYLKGFIPLL